MDELIKRFREKAGAFDYDGRPDIACDYEQAADAIEELLSERDKVNADSWKTAFEVERDEHRWIPVTERLPENYHQVLVYGLNGIQIDYYAGEKSIGGRPLFMISEAKVTHWMPLPEPPKEE